MISYLNALIWKFFEFYFDKICRNLHLSLINRFLQFRIWVIFIFIDNPWLRNSIHSNRIRSELSDQIPMEWLNLIENLKSQWIGIGRKIIFLFRDFFPIETDSFRSSSIGSESEFSTRDLSVFIYSSITIYIYILLLSVYK